MPKSEEIEYVDETVKPQEVTFFDPCMGSGHILVYAFDVLMEIYKECGYGERDAAAEIIQNNLFGLDIDERCSQLAYFAVMMKARSYDRRFLSRGIKPHVLSIRESNELVRFTHQRFMPDNLQNMIGEYLVGAFRHAKEIGSLQMMESHDYDAFVQYMDKCEENAPLDLELSFWQNAEKPLLEQLVEQAKVLSRQYAVACTNPPYMNKLEGHLKDFVVNDYKAYSGDLFSVFMYRNFNFCKADGYSAFMTPFVWMFIKTYENLRQFIIENKAITTLVQMEYSAFEEATVPICSFVLKNGNPTGDALCFRLSDFKGGMEVQKKKVLEAIENPDCGYFYEAQQSSFSKIPGSPVAYWVSEAFRNIFFCSKCLNEFSTVFEGLKTRDKERFLRFWFEVASKKWIHYAKGGAFRKWYGNGEYVVNWGDNGDEVRNFKKSSGTNFKYYFQPTVTYSALTSYKFSGRYIDNHIFGGGGGGITNSPDIKYILGYVNSSVFHYLMNILSQTLNFEVGQIGQQPLIVDSTKIKIVESMVDQNIFISKSDWDSFETSWDFARHSLVSGEWVVGSAQKTNHSTLITDHLKRWDAECTDRFNQLKANEEELNRIFIGIYGLQDELTPEVEDKDVTVRKADLGRDIRSLISYAVGCMFGRYSLDMPGLAYAGGEFSEQWVVVGGQRIHRREIEYYVGKELSRAFGMAEIHAVDRRSIQIDEADAERGIVFTYGSNEAGGSFDSLQYSRGTSKKLYEGICELPIDCKGFQSRIGDAAYDLCSPEILDAITNGNDNGLVRRGWKNADSIDWQTVHRTLTTNHYHIDEDNVIPICDDDYFDDDITGRFVKWVEAVYGKDTLEENLKFIADALGGKGTPRDVIRNYFLNDFYADHLKIYQKRPIYWLFDSGKKNGFKALIYMHRYQSDLLARMRTDYVHEQQERYRTQLSHLADAIDHASASERVKLTKQQKKIQEQALEIQKYEEKVHHLADMNISIDLDDGVKVNYSKFEDVLAKIK